MDVLYMVIPAYNEEANIEALLHDWYPVVETVAAEHEAHLVIVNDGSTDRTGEILDHLAASHPLLTVLHKPNGGHGSSLLYGYRYAIEQGADYIFQTDSDGQTLASEFSAFWEARHTYEAIFGMRPNRQDGKSRLFVENTLRVIVKTIFGVSVPDANAPFRLMRADRVKEYMGYMPADYNLPNVILTTAFVYKKRPVTFKEVTFRPRQGGKNSINMKRIAGIGTQAIHDFAEIRKKMNGFPIP